MSGYARYMKFSVVVLGMSVVQGMGAWAKDPVQLDKQVTESGGQGPVKGVTDVNKTQKSEVNTAKQQNPELDKKKEDVQQKQSVEKDKETQQETLSKKQPSETNESGQDVAVQQEVQGQQEQEVVETVDESVSSLPKIDSKLGIPPMEKFALHKLLRLREQSDAIKRDLRFTDSQIKETIKHVGVAYETDARLVIFGENSMQREGYELQQAEYFLDGYKIAEYHHNRSDATAPPLGPLFEGAVIPDCHTLRVRLDYLVKKRPFPYKTGYHVYMHGQQSFRSKEGQTLVLRSVGFTQEHSLAQGGKSGDIQAIQFVMQAHTNTVKGLPIVNLKDVLNEAGLEVFVQNKMPAEYKLIGFEIRLNGIPLKDYLRPEDAAQTGVLFRGPVLPGKEQYLQVQVMYQGQEKNYGYLGQHQFALNFERKIHLAANTTTPVQLTAFLGEPASFTVERTPSVRMEVSQASANASKIEFVDTCKPAAYFQAKQQQSISSLATQRSSSNVQSGAQESSPAKEQL